MLLRRAGGSACPNVYVPLCYVIFDIMKVMDYFEYPETRGLELIGAHAVTCGDNGTLNDTTECGIRVYFGPDSAELRPWEATPPLRNASGAQ